MRWRFASLVWAPDGDEAFDDSSYVLQFDVGERVRLIAFKRPDSRVDPASVREVWLLSDTFYNALRERRIGAPERMQVGVHFLSDPLGNPR